MHGGRLASVANKNELEDLIAATSIDEFWIGAYRSETPGGKIILSDGRRKVREGIPEQPVSSQTANQSTNTEDPNYIFQNVRSDCNTCNCGYVKDTAIAFIECHESHRYICEYKGGPSCPDRMFSLYGNCLGFVKNIMDDNTSNDKTCHFQSGAVHNYKLAQIDDIQVNIETKINRPYHLMLFIYCYPRFM